MHQGLIDGVSLSQRVLNASEAFDVGDQREVIAALKGLFHQTFVYHRDGVRKRANVDTRTRPVRWPAGPARSRSRQSSPCRRRQQYPRR